ncbi:AGAP002572-PA-like protein [Anopheles sinensis]|uniref:AGAP002572-PA-like protein n=1 Tax=Anopheles sinensis TaxID=74873 RepID=A0A084WRI8_ANOSI|nr:AGAP002572-PA-like protein [Anopheles sinensis]
MHPNGACHSVRAVCVMWLLHASVLLLPVAIRGHDSYRSEGSSKESVPSGAKYDNHLNTSQAFQPSELTGGYDSAELTADYGHGDGPDSPFNHHQFRCQACQYRNVYAMASLKSIKAHVLLKLGIEDLPNRTRYPEVPRHILDHFYNSQSYRSPDPDYLGDDPSSLQAEEPEEAEEDYDYYQITNKIYILPNRKYGAPGLTVY